MDSRFHKVFYNNNTRGEGSEIHIVLANIDVLCGMMY